MNMQQCLSIRLTLEAARHIHHVSLQVLSTPQTRTLLSGRQGKALPLHISIETMKRILCAASCAASMHSVDRAVLHTSINDDGD
jgi:hypothetical protein